MNFRQGGPGKGNSSSGGRSSARGSRGSRGSGSVGVGARVGGQAGAHQQCGGRRSVRAATPATGTSTPPAGSIPPADSSAASAAAPACPARAPLPACLPACSQLRGLHSTARKSEDPELQDFLNSKLHELVSLGCHLWCGVLCCVAAAGLAAGPTACLLVLLPPTCVQAAAPSLPLIPSSPLAFPTFCPPLPAGPGHSRDGQLCV
jgi:hypothetical protein